MTDAEAIAKFERVLDDSLFHVTLSCESNGEELRWEIEVIPRWADGFTVFGHTMLDAIRAALPRMTAFYNEHS